MDFKYVGHASVLVTDGDFSILTDPWFGEPLNRDTFRAYPPIEKLTSEEIKKVNAIHISHVHQDHLCPKTLAYFDPSIKILIAKYEDPFFKNKLLNLGFTNIIDILPGFQGTQLGPFNIHAFLPDKFNGSFDSAIVIRTKSQNYFLNNDCRLTEETYKIIHDNLGNFEGCFLGYTDFFPFPTCFDLTKCPKVAHRYTMESALREQWDDSWKHFSSVLAAFRPRWVVPYANGIRFLNEDFLIHNRTFNQVEKITEVNLHGSQAFVMQPGDLLHNGKVIAGPSRYESVPSSEHVLPTLLKNEISSVVLEKNKSAYENLFLSLFRKDIAEWKIPMVIKIIIQGKDSDLDLFFTFDGNEIQLSKGNPDLEVCYPAPLVNAVLEKTAQIYELTRTYQFRATFYNYIPNQMNVLSWRTS